LIDQARWVGGAVAIAIVVAAVASLFAWPWTLGQVGLLVAVGLISAGFVVWLPRMHRRVHRT
jgi:hypothetical protein